MIIWNVEMCNYFSIYNNVLKFEEIPYIDLRQIYLQMIGYTKRKKQFSISNKQEAIDK